VDDLVAEEVAVALNTWFRWILAGSAAPVPAAFESLGEKTADYAWSLGEDVDWEIGPHARVVGNEVRLAIETLDTHRHMAGLLKRLGARSVQVIRDEV